MKKMFTAAIALFLLASCSSDDDNSTSPSVHGNPDPNTVLIKKIINTFPSGFELTSIYVYDGIKVTEINKSDGEQVKFIYNQNNLPEEIRYYHGLMLNRTKYFEYDTNNRLTTYTLLYNLGDCLRTEYVYNPDGTITANHYSGNFAAANNFSHSEMYSFVNGKLVAINQGTEEYALHTVITYDEKNSFDKNIAGREILALTDAYSGTSNRISQSTTLDGTPIYNGIYNFSYTYNENNYPITASESLPEYSNIDFTTEYFYD